MKEQELRELDAWIAEHVMGGKPDPSKSVPFSSEQYCHPHYTTDPAAAMAVLEKCLSSDRLTMPIELDRKRHKAGRFRLESGLMKNSTLSIEDTLPLAICLFAKQLFGKEAK